MMGVDGKPVIQGNASNCLILRNMFIPAAETDPNWDINIQEDVDKKSDGNVYMMFDDVPTCKRVADEMNGRWYNRRQIQVSFISMGEYVNRFPDARRVASIAQAKMANSV